MGVFALVGTFLSFFHQGSLGGLYGVLQGRPFAFRESLATWPSTFFLFILSAAAVGPSFVLLTTWLVSKALRPRARQAARSTSCWQGLGLAAGRLRAAEVASTRWSGSTARRRPLGVHPARFYSFDPFGTWVLFTEIVLLGLVPALLLVLPRTRREPRLLVPAAFLACAGVVMNRFVMTVQTLALPDARVRPVPLVHAELAGGRELPRGRRLRRDPVLALVPLPQPVPARAGASA